MLNDTSTHRYVDFKNLVREDVRGALAPELAALLRQPDTAPKWYDTLRELIQHARDELQTVWGDDPQEVQNRRNRIRGHIRHLEIRLLEAERLCHEYQHPSTLRPIDMQRRMSAMGSELANAKARAEERAALVLIWKRRAKVLAQACHAAVVAEHKRGDQADTQLIDLLSAALREYSGKPSAAIAGSENAPDPGT